MMEKAIIIIKMISSKTKFNVKLRSLKTSRINWIVRINKTIVKKMFIRRMKRKMTLIKIKLKTILYQSETLLLLNSTKS